MRFPSALCLFVVSLVTIFVITVQPIHSGLTRLVFLAGVMGLIASGLFLGWRFPVVRWTFLVIVALTAALFLLPAREVDTDALRTRVVAELERYPGAQYVWGGENRTGIDCSGLPRRAFRDALFREGLVTLNGRLLRESVQQWWFDASARALAEGHRETTTAVGPMGKLRTLPFTTLLPGDLAVTTSGVHCLVYLGGDQWIQADPGLGRVAIYDARNTDDSWFDSPVTIHRWTLLDP